jgi:hypothetical protein
VAAHELSEVYPQFAAAVFGIQDQSSAVGDLKEAFDLRMTDYRYLNLDPLISDH